MMNSIGNKILRRAAIVTGVSNLFMAAAAVFAADIAIRAYITV
jgi:hypothetical protein